MSIDDSMKLTSVQNSNEDSLLCESSDMPGPSRESTFDDHEEKSHQLPPLPERDFCQSLCSMEHAPSKDVIAETGDILIPEESVIQEEIAEEVETSICECQEEDHKAERVSSEEPISPVGINEETETLSLSGNSEPCVVMNDVVDTLSHVEIKVEEKLEYPQEETSIMTDQLENSVSPSQSASSTNSLSNMEEKDVESTKELSPRGKYSPVLNGSLFAGGSVAVHMELQSDPDEQSSENACISETSFSSESPEEPCVSIASPGGDTQSTSEEPCTPVSLETACSSDVSCTENTEADSQQKPIDDHLNASLISEASPMPASPVTSEASLMSNLPLTSEASPVSNLPLPSETSPMSDLPLTSETSSVSSVLLASETSHSNSLPLPSETSPLSNSSVSERFILQQRKSPCLSEESLSPLKEEAPAIPNVSQEESLASQEKQPQGAPEVMKAVIPETSIVEESQARNLTNQPCRSHVEIEKSFISSVVEHSSPEVIKIRNHGAQQRTEKKGLNPQLEVSVLTEVTMCKNTDSLPSKPHDKLYTSSSEKLLYSEVGRSKSHKIQGIAQSSYSSKSEPTKSPELRGENRDLEIPKRKTAEHHGLGISKEKRARIDDDQYHRNSSASSSEREPPPREEPRVPPLKVK